MFHVKHFKTKLNMLIFIYMSIENPMNECTEINRKFTYRDNREKDSKGFGKVIFECDARNIIEADELYKKATGQNPECQNYIGCSIEETDQK